MPVSEPVAILTSGAGFDATYESHLRDFAQRFGWHPSDTFAGPPRTAELATGHLLVEHGLDDAAVVSFLPPARTVRNLTFGDQQALLEISYNNLVDWHVIVDANSVGYVYNRRDPPEVVLHAPVSSADTTALYRHRFEEVTSSRPDPQLPALDDAIIESISRWKRILAGHLRSDASNRELSSLFNALILTRAVEDLTGETNQVLVRILANHQFTGVRDIFEGAVEELTGSGIPEALLPRTALDHFDQLTTETLQDLFYDFYRVPGTPYRYDFSIMSKHALSRIYERYVSLLRYEDSPQLRLFPGMASERLVRTTGTVYTPQLIARFFARYLRENMTRDGFIGARVADVACGSGIFLRNVAELKLIESPLLNVPPDSRNAMAREIFQSLNGADIDPNAVSAARLSLALLFLVSTDELPSDLPVVERDALDIPASEWELEGGVDAFIVNPPFVSTESQSPELRARLVEYMEGIAGGRVDVYAAFIKLGIDAVGDGGFALFVLPAQFLTAETYKDLRRWVYDRAWIRFVVDLTAIPVFETAVYVILLGIQKHQASLPEPDVHVVTCKAHAGEALQDLLNGRETRSRSYSISRVPQTAFDDAEWSLRSVEEANLVRRLGDFDTVSHVAAAGQGVVTGDDETFIIDVEDVPEGEEEVYRRFLPDRQMGRFHVPEETGKRLFYPLLDGERLDQATVEDRFPETWRRLSDRRGRLESRSPVRRGNVEWWAPAWPRRSEIFTGPKLVAPHLSLLPKFALDTNGWLVGRSPLIWLKRGKKAGDVDLLKILVAILNSSVAAWYLDRNGRKYRSGYNEVSLAVLREFPIPPLASLEPKEIATAIQLVDHLSKRDRSANDFHDDFDALDRLVIGWYGLSPDELALVAP